MLGLGPRAAKTSLVFHIPHALWSWEAASLVQSGLSIQPHLKNKQIPEEHKERTHWKGFVVEMFLSKHFNLILLQTELLEASM